MTVTGDNTGATDTENFGNPNCWEAFSIDTCSTVTVSYCGTAPMFGLVYSILLIGCPGDVSVQNSDTSLCSDGNLGIIYANLSAGTYYVPILLWPGESEGPYTITFTSNSCDLPPANDRCIDAITVPVVQDCSSGGAVAGNNSAAVQNGAGPECAETTTQFQDVWYEFNSGTNDEVEITIAPGTMGDIGVEVLDSCGGNSVLCGIGGTSYTLAVAQATLYKVRVFSNNDFGYGGTFTICVSGLVPEVSCSGDTLRLADGDSTITVCDGSGTIVDFTIPTANTQTYVLVITDEADTIVGLYSGTSIDMGPYPPGTYHAWGVSHNGDLLHADNGEPVSGIASSADCADVSANFVTVNVEICEGIADPAPLAWSVITDPLGHALFIAWDDAPTRMEVDVYDVRGQLVGEEQRMVARGERVAITGGRTWSSGLYSVCVRTSGQCVTKRAVVL